MKKFRIYGFVAIVCIMCFSLTAGFAQTAKKAEMFRAGKAITQKDVAHLYQYTRSKDKVDPKTVKSVTVNGQEVTVGEKLDAAKATMLNDVYNNFMEQNKKNDAENAAKTAASKAKKAAAKK